MSLLEGYRLFTGYYIYESEELVSEAKLEFIQFLKEASADDIVDILSGQYEGVEGLSEEEMTAVHDFLEEKFGVPKIAKTAAGAISKRTARPRKFLSKKLGYTKVGAEKKKLADIVATKAKGKGSLVKKGEKYAKQKGAVRKAYAGAVGRTALAATPAAAAGGGAYYMKKK